MNWRSLPKVELHLHLEGAAPPGFIRDEAAGQGVALPDIFREDGAYRWSDFAEFLKVYEAASSVLKGPAAYHRLTAAVLADRAAEGVIYAEMFLAPQLVGGGDPGLWHENFAAISSVSHPGIEVRYIPVCIRHMGGEGAEKTAQMVVGTRGAAGFGLAGEERYGHPSDYARAFDIAREALPVTAHAGEFGGPASVRAALDHLKVRRIGHGVRAIEDAELVRRLADEGIVLEVCPGSNISLGLYPGWAEHPVAELDRAGVAVTLSTDDPPYFHTTLPEEYAALAKAHDWDGATFTRFNRVAMGAAFCDEATRARILAQLPEAP